MFVPDNLTDWLRLFGFGAVLALSWSAGCWLFGLLASRAKPKTP
jgi:hypothetical protein